MVPYLTAISASKAAASQLGGHLFCLTLRVVSSPPPGAAHPDGSIPSMVPSCGRCEWSLIVLCLGLQLS
eukprot:9625768-Karenia_brevis.AAC.1